MLFFVYGVIFMLYAVPITNIVLLITYWVLSKKLIFKGFPVVLILLVLEFVLFKWAFLDPGKDGGVFGQLLMAEIVGIVAIIIQVLYIAKCKPSKRRNELINSSNERVNK